MTIYVYNCGRYVVNLCMCLCTYVVTVHMCTVVVGLLSAGVCDCTSVITVHMCTFVVGVLSAGVCVHLW